MNGLRLRDVMPLDGGREPITPALMCPSTPGREGYWHICGTKLYKSHIWPPYCPINVFILLFAIILIYEMEQ